MQGSTPTNDSNGPSRRERLTYLVGASVIGLHVADDSFIQPQAGTSAGDHLASGLVPLAVLGLAAAIFLRAKAGIRGALALITGFAGLVASVEGAYYASEVGPSGDDFTGLLCIPAGIAIVGLGVVTLWRSRKREGSSFRRLSRRTLLSAGGFLALVLVMVPLGYAYVLTHVARPPVEDIDLRDFDAEEVQLHTSDGVTLEGSYVPSRNGAAVIVAFGRLKTQPHARMLADHGYGVLIFDRRGEGESGGDPNPYAWDEGELDLNAAVDFLESRPDVDPGRIGGLGLSVGGETLLQTAANDERIAALVSEGAASRSVGEALSLPGETPPGMIAFNIPVTAGTALFSDATPPEHLIDQVDEIGRPVMLLYATEGTAGEEARANPAYYEAASPQAEIWEIPEAEHVGGLEARPEEYEGRVVGFFDDALRGNGR